MRGKTKIWLVTATVLTVLGCALFAVALSVCDWDFTKLSTVNYQTKTYEINEEFDSITLETDTADLFFAIAEDGQCKVVCDEEENTSYAIQVIEGTLCIELVNEKEWYDYIGFNFYELKVTVHLPKTEYDALFIKESTGDIHIPKEMCFTSMDISVSTGDINCYASATEKIKIKTSTGDILLENLSVGALELAVTTGKVTASGIACEGSFITKASTGKTVLKDVSCKRFNTHSTTGDVSLNNLIALESLSMESSTGDIKLEKCDGAEIFIKTSTGDVRGTLLSEKIFITETGTGRVRVPNSIAGGRCQITTGTGDITMEIVSQ